MWGPREYDGSVIILLDEEKGGAEKICDSVEEFERVSHPYAMEEEQFDILVCRGLKTPLAERWPKIKHWN